MVSSTTWFHQANCDLSKDTTDTEKEKYLYFHEPSVCPQPNQRTCILLESITGCWHDTRWFCHLLRGGLRGLHGHFEANLLCHCWRRCLRPAKRGMPWSSAWPVERRGVVVTGWFESKGRYTGASFAEKAGGGGTLFGVFGAWLARSGPPSDSSLLGILWVLPRRSVFSVCSQCVKPPCVPNRRILMILKLAGHRGQNGYTLRQNQPAARDSGGAMTFTCCRGPTPSHRSCRTCSSCPSSAHPSSPPSPEPL
jgi:hypothetical protein